MLLGDRRGEKIHSAGGQTARSGFFFFLKKERIKSTIAQRVPKCDTLKSLLGFFFFFFNSICFSGEVSCVCFVFVLFFCDHIRVCAIK